MFLQASVLLKKACIDVLLMFVNFILIRQNFGGKWGAKILGSPHCTSLTPPVLFQNHTAAT